MRPSYFKISHDAPSHQLRCLGQVQISSLPPLCLLVSIYEHSQNCVGFLFMLKVGPLIFFWALPYSKHLLRSLHALPRTVFTTPLGRRSSYDSHFTDGKTGAGEVWSNLSQVAQLVSVESECGGHSEQLALLSLVNTIVKKSEAHLVCCYLEKHIVIWSLLRSFP